MLAVAGDGCRSLMSLPSNSPPDLDVTAREGPEAIRQRQGRRSRLLLRGIEVAGLAIPLVTFPNTGPACGSTAELLLALHPRRAALSARWWVEAVRCPEDKADAVLLVHRLLWPRARGVSIRRRDRDPEGYGGDDRKKKQTPHPILSVGAARLTSIGRGPGSRRLLVTFPNAGPPRTTRL